MTPTTLDLQAFPQSNTDRVIPKLSGKLSLETVHGFLQTVRPEAAKQLILDMNGVSFLDSAGVGALVQVYVHRRSLGQSFVLTGLSKQSCAVMQVAGLTRLLPIHASVEDALAAKSQA